MGDRASRKSIRADYKKLKSAINPAPGDFNTFKRLSDAFTPLVHAAGFAEKIAQVPVLVSGAGAAAGPFIPAVSAALGVVTFVTTGAGLWKGLGKAQSDEVVRGYKTEFNRAARGFLGNQFISTLAMGTSALCYGVGEHFGVAVGNGSPLQVFIGAALGAVGMVTGFRAHANASKLSVYATAIKNAKNPVATLPAVKVETPTVPSV